MITANLIFDIGLHTGRDANFYLSKGFRVVGVEAREDLCNIARQANKEAVENGRLHIVQRALFERAGETVTFYINDRKDDWGSLYRGAPEQDGSIAREIRVPSITLDELFGRYGIPYYIKCDIEGGDALFAEQLLQSKHRPSYVSIEATSIDDLAKIRAAGYNSFQIVNQYLNPNTVAPNPSREGKYVDTRFTHEMSGLFGRDLPHERWADFRTTIKRLLDWYDLWERDRSLAIGWLDIHSRMDW